MKRKIPIIIAVLLILGFIGVYFIAFPCLKLARSCELLRYAGIEKELKFELLDYTYWKDLLCYVSGYEMTIVQVEPEKWIAPEGWSFGEISLSQIVKTYEKVVGNSMLRERELNIMDMTFQEWFYVETDRTCFDNWQYYIGLYREDGLLVVYRGHDLNSELFLL